MTIQLSAGSFLQMLAHSGLLSDEQLQRVEQRFSPKAGRTTAREICDWLQKQGLITEWQAEKLRQAKFRGFFLGPYKLLSRVARGGMSSIYAARHRDSGEVHALKVLPPARTNQASYLPRFQREAAMTQRLQHPNIVRVFGVFSESDGQDAVHFMAMELLSGRDLFEIVNTDGPLPCRQTAEFIRQAALGLEFAHQAGMVHRDIKPGNLFVTGDGQVRILDLGLAQDFDSEENLTRDFNERVLGTADYLAPEQAADSHTVDGRADIYSLGCSLYFLLTGQPPFTEGTLVQRLVAHQKNTPPPLSQFRNDIPEELAAIVSAMMVKNRNQRIGSAAEVANRLARFLADTADQPALDQHPPALHGATGFAAQPAGRVSSQPSVLGNRAAESAQSGTKVVAGDGAAEAETDSEIDIRHSSDTAPLASEDSAPDGLPTPFDSGTELSVESAFLPEFNGLLLQIENECQSSGTLSTDPRSARLLETVRDLMTSPDNADRASGDAANQAIAVTTEPTSERESKQQSLPSIKSFRRVVIVSLVLLLAVVASTFVDWNLVRLRVHSLWEQFVR